EIDLAVFEVVQHLVLLIGLQLREDVAERFLAVLIDALDAEPINLRGRERQLVALLLGAEMERSAHVDARGLSEGTRELRVDEVIDACLHRARAERVRRNQAIDRGAHEAAFVAIQETRRRHYPRRIATPAAAEQQAGRNEGGTAEQEGPAGR